jgi:hypothetical protein
MSPRPGHDHEIPRVPAQEQGAQAPEAVVETSASVAGQGGEIKLDPEFVSRQTLEPCAAGDAVARWRADRTQGVDAATFDLVKRAFQAVPELLEVEFRMDHSSGHGECFFWLEGEAPGSFGPIVPVEHLLQHPGYPQFLGLDADHLKDLADIAFDRCDEAEHDRPQHYSRSVVLEGVLPRAMVFDQAAFKGWNAHRWSDSWALEGRNPGELDAVSKRFGRMTITIMEDGFFATNKGTPNENRWMYVVSGRDPNDEDAHNGLTPPLKTLDEALAWANEFGKQYLPRRK